MDNYNFGPFDEEAEDLDELEIYDEELLTNSEDDLVEEFNYDIDEVDEETDDLDDIFEVDDLDSAREFWDSNQDEE